MIEGRSRTELLAGAVFCTLSLIVPFAFTELYPFSMVPVFADAPKVLCDYRAWDPSGRRIPLELLGLQQNYWGIPASFPSGLKPPVTLDVPGQVPDEARVREYLTPRLAEVPALPFVIVEQRVLGDLDSNRVGVTRVTRWTIPNAAAKQAGTP